MVKSSAAAVVLWLCLHPVLFCKKLQSNVRFTSLFLSFCAQTVWLFLPHLPLLDASQCIVLKMSHSSRIIICGIGNVRHVFSTSKVFTSIDLCCWPQPTFMMYSDRGGLGVISFEIVETEIHRVDNSTCPIENHPSRNYWMWSSINILPLFYHCCHMITNGII